MNIREWIGPVLLSFGIVLLFRTYWQWGDKEKQQTEFVAPLTSVEVEPLRCSIAVEQKTDFQQDKQEIKTDHGHFVFSNRGAVVDEMTFSREISGAKQSFVILPEIHDTAYEMAAFLVAFDDVTPLNYVLIKREETDVYVALTYQTKMYCGVIEKTFEIFKHTCQMNLRLTVIPEQGKSLRPRIVWPSPDLRATVEDDFVNALIFDKKGKFVKKTYAGLDEHVGYFAPRMFGTEDKYFSNSMVKDVNNFAVRAYFKPMEGRLVSFLEGPVVSEEKIWNFTFYIGPKDADAIKKVAPEFERSLDYGMFSFFTKAMLFLLEQCYKYVGNFGLAIIILTLLLKLALLPFTYKGEQKIRKMQEYQKKLSYLEQKYKHDSEALNAAREQLVRAEGLPGMGGCLPIVLQGVVLGGLYGALNNSIELYKAPFMGWIQDLSIPDPYYILSILIVIAVIFTSFVADKKVEFKKIVISLCIALFLGAWTSTMAAGLALYICCNAILHLAQMQIQKSFGL